MTMRRKDEDCRHIIRIPTVYHASPDLPLMEHLPVDLRVSSNPCVGYHPNCAYC